MGSSYLSLKRSVAGGESHKAGFFLDENMTDFIRSLFESVLKSNDSLEFAVITGCLRVRKEIEELIAGKELKKPVHEDITYADIKETQDNLWNFLFFTGYLKMTGQSLEGNTIYLKLSVPNEEVRYIYQNTIQEWFKKSVRSKDLSSLKDYEILSNRESGNGRTDILSNYNIILEEWNHDKDHVHILFRAHPNTEISKFINA